MTKVPAEATCESYGGMLIPPLMMSGVEISEGTDYVCLKCNRPYRWIATMQAIVAPERSDPELSDSELKMPKASSSRRSRRPAPRESESAPADCASDHAC